MILNENKLRHLIREALVRRVLSEMEDDTSLDHEDDEFDLDLDDIDDPMSAFDIPDDEEEIVSTPRKRTRREKVIPKEYEEVKRVFDKEIPLSAVSSEAREVYNRLNFSSPLAKGKIKFPYDPSMTPEDLMKAMPGTGKRSVGRPAKEIEDAVERSIQKNKGVYFDDQEDYLGPDIDDLRMGM